MDILWWLAPAGVTTLLAIVWVTWVGRDGHGVQDRDESVARLARALEHEHPVRQGAPKPSPAEQRPRDRSTGIAVRPLRQPPRQTLRQVPPPDAPVTPGSDAPGPQA
ncbi:hypothetical protein [Nocardioides yefusunii]|uniref:Uncharacterized protein n=1 Tax=Nocardioides yefusunii TaxID=2500546 RepID=A0ABW1R0V5_9ACTN|nr:hypothetical protein [Nocardioides yefusunii]